MALSLVPEDSGPDGGSSEVRVDPLSGARVLVDPPSLGLPSPHIGPGPTFAPARSSPWATAAPEPPSESHRDLFGTAPAHGIRELLELPAAHLADLDAKALAAAVGHWSERMGAHPDAAYVHVGVDDGAGRAELHALSFVPALVARERERFGAHATRTMGSDLLGDVVQEEVRRRVRLVAYDADCVLIAPWASAVAFQLLVAPRRPAPRFAESGSAAAGMLAEALRRLDAVLGTTPVSVVVRTAPRGTDRFSWRIDVRPGPADPTTLELGTGLPRNPVAPEVAAQRLRDAGR